MIEKFLDVFLLLGRLVRAIVARANAAKEQRERNALHKDPAGWFDNHFDGGLHGDIIENETTETHDPD